MDKTIEYIIYTGKKLVTKLLNHSVVLLFSLLFPVHLFAGTYTVETIPNVRLTDAKNHVSNPDYILSSDDVRTINMYLNALEDSTGIEVAVVAVESIGYNDARMFATELFKHWGIGKKADDNGLLIQLVTEPSQRSVVFETGYGIEGVLPDIICYRLQQRYMIPYMKQGSFSAGMLNGIIAVSDYLLSSDYERKAMTGTTSGEGENTPFWLFFLLFISIFTGIPLGILWYKHRPRICPRCGQKTFKFVRRQIVQQATYTSDGMAVDIYRCTNCGYTEEKHRKINRLKRDAAGPVIFGSGGGGRGGFSGGSWGGGRSGGGGAISRF
ncbi:MAG: TPM domain-containing protein [Tannerellaceae bacterium]|jgi:uncharacterized protein|nr:TPM domain-containing protein [Tannerellaceae bacterium]